MRACVTLLLLLAALAASATVKVLAGPASVRLSGHLLPASSTARIVGNADPNENVSLAIGLPLRNEAALQGLLARLYDPHDPLYGRYLGTTEFVDRFAPTAATYSAVAAFARASGLTVTGVHANRLVLDVSGPAAAVEQAFQLHLRKFQDRDGRVYRAPDAEPAVPGVLAGCVSAVVGLDDRTRLHPHLVRPRPAAAVGEGPRLSGSGPGGGFSPSDIKKAYNLTGVPFTGSGQTLALFELDGYTASDITAYENQFGLPAVPLQNILIDGFDGSAGPGADEVTLDIELQIALAPGVRSIIVYEAPNSGTGVIDTYSRIASDNLAKSISTSWGIDEATVGSAFANLEKTVFQQMATQGQSIYAAAGDAGAYDDGQNISVDDPASDPWMTGVGGTALTTSGPGGAWLSETTWNTSRTPPVGGGGGISTLWTIPNYQTGVVGAASLGSATMRNVPDVALDADPNTGYAIFVGGSWEIIGGTSAAAPLWAAFTALVNEGRVSQGTNTLGFANPSLYTIGSGAQGTTAFHDIADNSTNLQFPAVTGFDDATGWGSFNGTNLLTALLPSANGSLQFPQTSYTVLDGSTLSITLTRSTTTTDAFVTVTSADGTAVSPADYTGISTTLEFPIGSSSQTITLSTSPDRLLRAPLTFSLTLSNAIGVTLGSRVTTSVSIAMDRSTRSPSDVTADALPHAVALSWTDNAENTNSFKVERSSDGSSWTTVAPAVADTSLTDSNPPLGVPLIYRVTAQNGIYTSLPSDPSAPVTIPFPDVQFSADNYTVSAGATATVVVRRQSSAGTASVTIDTFDDSAVAPDDYTAVSKNLTFPPGVNSVSVAIPTHASASLQDALTVDLELSNPVNLSLGDTSSSTLTIVPDLSRSAPSNAVAFVSGPSSITVQWNSHSIDEDEFKIERSNNNGPFQVVGTADAGETQFVDNTVSPGGTVYYYRVRATRFGDSGDIDSAPSNKTVGLSIPAGGRLQVNPTRLSFTSKSRAATVTRRFTITNAGKGPLAAYVAPVQGNGFRIISGSGNLLLGSKKKWTVVVQFSPGASGLFTDTISISSSAGSATVELKGKAK